MSDTRSVVYHNPNHESRMLTVEEFLDYASKRWPDNFDMGRSLEEIVEDASERDGGSDASWWLVERTEGLDWFIDQVMLYYGIPDLEGEDTADGYLLAAFGVAAYMLYDHLYVDYIRAVRSDIFIREIMQYRPGLGDNYVWGDDPDPARMDIMPYVKEDSHFEILEWLHARIEEARGNA